MILLETRPTAAECWVIACDVCGHALDPGELDATDGGWSTQRAAYDAADARGWQTDVLEVGRDLCPPCQVGIKNTDSAETGEIEDAT